MLCTSSHAVCDHLDLSLVNLEATVNVGKIPEFLSSTTQWQHVRDEHFKFHKVV